MDPKVICRALTGPTASGKTALSLKLARKAGWEIACMDSMQIYRGMDIGTAKPTAAERAAVPHHLLDLCDAKARFSVSLYREMAEKLIRQKAGEGKELLFVGGTGLYLQALMYPMGMGTVAADETLREKLWLLAEQPEGKKALHGMLRSLDPETAERLPLNDVRRTIRAIEVTRATGIPFSRQPQRPERSPFEWRAVALKLPREILYERINLRVEKMFAGGLEKEVRDLLSSGVPEDAQSMQALGYKETVRYLKGEWTKEKAVEEIQKGTRHYAKRQETFLRRDPDIQWFDALEPDLESRVLSSFTAESSTQ